ncbi:hypothetical protein ABE61_21075 [Lysinibacillus sphaericus]|uniref:hypothetical protein n=1 Tax=Lysinibacillus sphaericus TaxID=1421 RepID=UPI0018CF2E8F|nr:hypothetical protein [Lysinibacillus sphaericus]MBG9456438.1 hypothetical protein [Lysinibacillus sphaericus]MBG9476512.1 hypothetical protein [Lysinibacillus sphaericus]MBG9594624.1 hypothetical protein [Lysinibacillus sphaericus]
MKYLAHSILKNENSSKIRFLETSEETKRELEENFKLPFLNQALLEWYYDLPKSKDIMFYWTNDFYVIGKENLMIALEGYRFIKEARGWEDSSEKMKWNQNWIIISSWSGNPVIADISKEDTPIYYDYVGGEFSPKLLVDSMEKFDYFLSVWLDKHDDQYYKSGEYQSDFYELMEKEWKTKLSNNEIKNICEFLPIIKSKENFAPLEQRIKEKVGKYYVYLDDPGENKSKVLLAVKKETGLSFDEIRNRLNSKGFLIAEGYGENTLVLADYFISLGAKVRTEQK